MIKGLAVVVFLSVMGCSECLDVAAYMGRWYEQYRDKWFIFEQGECSRALYYYEDSAVKVTNSEERVLFYYKYWAVQEGYLKCTDGTNNCEVSFPLLWGLFWTRGDYYVVETDYSSYSLVVSRGWGSSVAWVLTRETNPEQSKLDELVKRLHELYPGYEVSRLRRTQQNC